ncbi:MAG: isoprenyl transferase [Phototrophicales bacterium]|nr:MAG: isoprenyl transferase [Phototrophicales bacterium]RMG78001.1 MAG: isoprenyl transferase [Chloroflexota bacterium]
MGTINGTTEKQSEQTPNTLPPVIPRHVAVIMDGNGRWAKARGLPRTAGHHQGKENLRRILEACVEFGIEILTIYAFSTENWGRPPKEVRILMSILNMVLDQEVNKLDQEGVQVRHIGKLEGVSPHLQKKILQACEQTKNNNRLILNVAFNYGGRDEIVHAVQEIIRDGIPPEEVTEDLISRYLYTGGLPDPDLIIRTSGEFRLSNFLLWQGAYSEYYSTPTYWPDFDKTELLKALWAFSHRRRRFGMTDEQIDKLDQS